MVVGDAGVVLGRGSALDGGLLAWWHGGDVGVGGWGVPVLGVVRGWGGDRRGGHA